MTHDSPLSRIQTVVGRNPQLEALPPVNGRPGWTGFWGLLSALLLIGFLCLGVPFLLAQPAGTPEDTVYIAELWNEPAAADIPSPGAGAGALQSRVRDGAVVSRLSRVRQEQEDFVSILMADLPANLQRRVFVAGSASMVLNALFVRTDSEGAAAIRARPEVKSVAAAVERRPLLDEANQIVNSQELWNAVGGADEAGRGVRIAIVDSGINLNNLMFSEDGLAPPAGYPKSSVGGSDFTNSKVIVARSFWNLFPNPGAPNLDITPRDELGHGTRVAAVAAGRRVSAPLASISGVAPLAYLGNYKVFGNPAYNNTTTSAAVIAAIDQAILDGMDVINLSLGGPPPANGPDYEQQAISRAVQAGVVVVAAAGNDGPGARSVTAPGTSPDVITVGAVSNRRVFGPGIEIQASTAVPPEIELTPYTAGAYGSTLQTLAVEGRVGPLPVVSAESVTSNELACDPLPGGSLNGKIALVRRGICTFQVKADRVFAAGAAAMVVYNHEPGGTIIMQFNEKPPLPAVMIDLQAGEGMRDFANSAVSVLAVIHSTNRDDLLSFPREADELQSFSGRGPTPDHRIKPDLVAVGNSIYSASAEPNGYHLNSSGTSFSAPMVAGGAALLRQLYPTWNSQQIKGALVGSAAKTVTNEGLPAHVLQVGNGRLDLAAAARASGAFEPVNLAFSYFEAVSFGVSSAKQLHFTNLSATSRTFDFDYVSTVANPSAKVTLKPSSLTLSPGDTALIEVRVSFSEPATGGPFEGFVRARSSPDRFATASVWGVVVGEGSGRFFTISKSGPADFRSIRAAVEASLPGDILEITDDGVYTDPIVIAASSQGTPLDGLTLRAAAGARPVIDVSGSAPGSPAVQVTDGARVRLEGLRLVGGRESEAVSFRDAGGAVVDCSIVGAPDYPAGWGISVTRGRAHLYGNRIESSGGLAVGVSAGDVLAQGNRIDNSTGIHSGGGILLADSTQSALFDNRIEGIGSGEATTGLSLSISNAVVAGNRITSMAGSQSRAVSLARGLWKSSSIDLRHNILEGNGLAGLELGLSTTGRAENNLFLDNSTAGAYLHLGASLGGSGNGFLRNGAGILMTGSDLRLANGIVANSLGPGIRLTDHPEEPNTQDSSLVLQNVTVASNLEEGVGVVQGSPILKVINSILSGNGGADLDLSPETAAEASYALFGPGPHPSGTGVLAGDPLLIDPPAGDFRLAPGSPAIDAGSFPPVGALDYLGHRRVADGGLGERLDLGAVEAGSPWAPSLLLPLLSAAPGDFVGLALVNAEAPLWAAARAESPMHDPHPTRLAFRNANSTTASFHPIDLAPGRQYSVLLSELSGDGFDWLEIQPENPEIHGFALLGDYRLSKLDGVPLSAQSGSVLYFPEVEISPGHTRLMVVNPASSPAVLTLHAYTDGLPQQAEGPTIPARGALSMDVSDYFDNLASGTYLKVSSNQGLYAVAVVGSDETVAALPGLPHPENAEPEVLYGAQLAIGSGIETWVSIVNPGLSQAVLLEAFDESGTRVADKTVLVGQHGSIHQAASSLFELDDLVGWLRVTPHAATVLGSIRFSDPVGRFSAALPLESKGSHQFVLSHVAQNDEIFTGITLLNPGSVPSLVSIEVFSQEGSKTGLALTELGAGEKRALLLPEWVPGLQEQVDGYIRIRSTGGIIGFELFGSEDFLAAVPPQGLLVR